MISQDDPFILVAHAPELFERLKSLNYELFLEACVTRLKIEPGCYDVFLSELDNEAFQIFEIGFRKLAPRAKAVAADNGFLVHSGMLIADLILPIMGRVHEEMLRSLDHFTKMLGAVGGNPNSMFLNAKSPTPESQFIQFWIALKLGIPTELPGGGIIAVV